MTARVIIWHVVSELINQKYTIQDILTFLDNVDKYIGKNKRPAVDKLGYELQKKVSLELQENESLQEAEGSMRQF